ncbi:glycosyltransferase family 31 protein, partial [Periconia macrospinosa]
PPRNMPLLTPSRIVSGVLSLIFLTLLWRYGMPEDISSYRQPILGHDDHPHFPSSASSSSPQDKKTGHDTSPLLQADQQSTSTIASDAPGPTQIPHITPNTPCRDVRGASDVLIVLRTSKAELEKNKLPAHITKLLSCAPNVAIYSDHAGTATVLDTSIPVYDALDTIAQKTSFAHDEFREYDKMKADKAYTPSSRAASELDKWKFLPMVYKAFTTKPPYRFYLFLESDTSITWTNLLQWLDRLDYRIHYYTGAPLTTADTKVRYPQSGPGILLSWGALRRYAKSYGERYAGEWESYVGKESGGDVMLANAMAESSVEFVSSFPILQPESPSTLEWTERHWCKPIISWYKPDNEDTEALQKAHEKWTMKRGWGTPFLARDAFEEVLLPKLSKMKADWDNMASDTVIKGEPGWREKQAQAQKEKDQKEKEEKARLQKEDEARKKKEAEEKEAEKARLRKEKEDENKYGKRASPPLHSPRLLRPRRAETNTTSTTTATPEQKPLAIEEAAFSQQNCEATCHATRDCLQWRYTSFGDGECHLGRNVLKEVEKEMLKEREWSSGWIVERIESVTRAWKVCEEPDWRFNG